MDSKSKFCLCLLYSCQQGNAAAKSKTAAKGKTVAKGKTAAKSKTAAKGRMAASATFAQETEEHGPKSKKAKLSDDRAEAELTTGSSADGYLQLY